MQRIAPILFLVGLWWLPGNLSAQQDPLDIPKLIRWLTDKDAMPSQKASAASLLGNGGVKAAVPAIVPLLRYSDSRVQTQALLALNNLGAVTESAQIRRLLRVSNPELRANAALTLLHFDDTASLPTILRMLDSESLDLRRKMAVNFRVYPIPEAVPALIKALEDPDLKVRQNAIAALGVIALPSSEDSIRPFLDSDDESLRSVALGAVVNIAPENYRERLREDFDSGNDNFRRRSVFPLTRLEDPDVEELLLEETPASPMLNYFHAREACEKIRGTRVPLRKLRHISLERALAVLSEAVDMPIEISPSVQLIPRQTKLYNSTGLLGFRPEVFGFLTNVNKQMWAGVPDPVSWIIDEDVIRLVTPAEATEFFKAEAKKRKGN